MDTWLVIGGGLVLTVAALKLAIAFVRGCRWHEDKPIAEWKREAWK